MIIGNHVSSSNRAPVARFQAMRLCYSSLEPNTSDFRKSRIPPGYY